MRKSNDGKLDTISVTVATVNAGNEELPLSQPPSRRDTPLPDIDIQVADDADTPFGGPSLSSLQLAVPNDKVRRCSVCKHPNHTAPQCRCALCGCPPGRHSDAKPLLEQTEEEGPWTICGGSGKSANYADECPCPAFVSKKNYLPAAAAGYCNARFHAIIKQTPQIPQVVAQAFRHCLDTRNWHVSSSSGLVAIRSFLPEEELIFVAKQRSRRLSSQSSIAESAEEDSSSRGTQQINLANQAIEAIDQMVIADGHLACDKTMPRYAQPTQETRQIVQYYLARVYEYCEFPVDEARKRARSKNLYPVLYNGTEHQAEVRREQMTSEMRLAMIHLMLAPLPEVHRDAATAAFFTPRLSSSSPNFC